MPIGGQDLGEHGRRWKRCDLHMHTRFSGWRSLRALDARDCYVEPREAFDTARARGMDFVCFSDHDTIDGALDFLGRYPELEPWVIVAEEVEARFPGTRDWVHLNVYDVDERLHDDITRARADCFALVEELTRRGIYFSLNHPFQSFRTRQVARHRLDYLLAHCPAVEVLNSTSPQSHQAVLTELLSESRDGGPVWLAGSDAHTVRRIGAAYTAAPGADKRAYLASLRSGETLICGAAEGLPALVCDVYAVVATFYAQRRLWPLDLTRLQSLALAGALLPAVAIGVPALLTVAQALRQELIARGYDVESKLIARALAAQDAGGGS